MKIIRSEDEILTQVKRIHMIGIGGSGMCPIAEILHSRGYKLSGSDNNESDPLKRVIGLGIPVTLGHNASNVAGAELVVYSAAISQDNPEMVAAKEQGIPTMERSVLLGILTRQYDNVIGVSGTHGKTTVSSMITQILYMNNLDPTAVIGGRLPIIGANGRAGTTEHMVCESCEFVDTFLQLSPDLAVLLNIDNDHLDYFKTMDNLIASFSKFVHMANTVFVNGDDALCDKAVADIKGNCITFGLKTENDYYATEIAPGMLGMKFVVNKKGKPIANVQLSIPGNHNVYNALAAFAVADYIGVDPDGIATALEAFHGAGRRFEILGKFGGITLADDYAHHPTEIKATLQAAKGLTFKRVIVLFQPFTFSRTAMLLDDFKDALAVANKVVLTPIMGSREVNTYGIKSEDIAEALSDCYCAKDFADAAEYITSTALDGDIILTMGGGDIYKAAYIMKDILSQNKQERLSV